MSNAALASRIADAIGAHGLWKMKLRTAINTGRSDVTPMVARCDDQCGFGKWLYGPELDATTRQGLPYQVIKRLHADFHRSAGDVLSLAVKGDKTGAQTLMEGEFTERSEKLVRALNKWRREAA